jgi:hypothetical protein
MREPRLAISPVEVKHLTQDPSRARAILSV